MLYKVVLTTESVDRQIYELFIGVTTETKATLQYGGRLSVSGQSVNITTRGKEKLKIKGQEQTLGLLDFSRDHNRRTPSRRSMILKRKKRQRINPLSPNTDHHQISPCNINAS